MGCLLRHKVSADGIDQNYIRVALVGSVNLVKKVADHQDIDAKIMKM